VVTQGKNNRDCRCNSLCTFGSRRPVNDNDFDLKLNQFSCEVRESVSHPMGVPLLDGDVLPLHIAEITQTLSECVKLVSLRRRPPKKTYLGDSPWLLRFGDGNSCQKESCQLPDPDSYAHRFRSAILLITDH
jgi:hypothetical protein